MSKQEIMAAITKLGTTLGRAPSLRELKRSLQVRDREIYKHFATYTQALEACGLERQGRGHPVAVASLFSDWAPIARKLGKVPTVIEYQMHSRYSIQPLYTRFGSWSQSALGLKVYAEENGLGKEWEDVMAMVRTHSSRPLRGQAARGWARGGKSSGSAGDSRPVQTIGSGESHDGVADGLMRAGSGLPLSKVRTDRPTYGPTLVPGPLAHGPVNEAGVIYLFGMLAERLGFVVTRIQTEFPDCEAMRRVDTEEERWQRLRIEFEYESRNFVKHLHNAEECDAIVCWVHNWPECPLEVVELRRVVG